MYYYIFINQNNEDRDINENINEDINEDMDITPLLNNIIVRDNDKINIISKIDYDYI